MNTSEQQLEMTAVANCRMCGSASAVCVAELQGGVQYLQCQCGVTYPSPFPTDAELDAVYNTGYMDLELPGHGLHIRFKDEYKEPYRIERDLTLRDLGIEPETMRGKRILDFGCANGIFLDYLRGHGVDGTGLDISEEMVAAARDNGLDARTTSLFDLEGQWDVACMWDVIEHLTDPVAVLVRLSEVVSIGGELLIQTPCTGIISDSFSGAWRNYIYPQHVHLFSHNGLGRWLNHTGFQIEQWVRFGSGNTSGTIPAPSKLAADRVAKVSGHGDTIALRARRVDVAG